MTLASSGPPGEPLGGLLGRLEPSECREEANAQILQDLLEASWVVLGRLGGFLGELGGILDSLGPSWRPSWTILGGLGGHLGPSWRPSWANVAILEAILSRLGGFFGNWAISWASYGSCGGGKLGSGSPGRSFRVAGGTGRSPRGSSFGKEPKANP